MPNKRVPKHGRKERGGGNYTCRIGRKTRPSDIYEISGDSKKKKWSGKSFSLSNQSVENTCDLVYVRAQMRERWMEWIYIDASLHLLPGLFS